MPDDTMPEATRLSPGEKYRPDATFDLTKKIAWAVLEDEEIRTVDRPTPWLDPGTITNELMRERAVQFEALTKPVYLAVWSDEARSRRYLGYDGIYSGFPVNQIPFLREWKPFTARAAHEFDWTMSAHSMQDLTANQRQTVEQQMYGLISAPWQIMALLEDTDPKNIDSFASGPLWKVYQTEVEGVLAGLCHECEDLATFARRFAHQANLELFRGALVSGKVYTSNRDVTKWGLGTVVTEAVAPSGTTPSAESITAFHADNRLEYLKAVKFYDTEVGVSERPHSHD